MKNQSISFEGVLKYNDEPEKKVRLSITKNELGKAVRLDVDSEHGNEIILLGDYDLLRDALVKYAKEVFDTLEKIME